MARFFSKALQEQVMLKGYLKDALTLRIDRKINKLRSVFPAPYAELEAVERVHYALKNHTPISWTYISTAFPDLKPEDFNDDNDPGFEHIP